METVNRIAPLLQLLRGYRENRESIAFVPTMGALHEGHLSLVRRAREIASRVVLSIYVNPIQFGPAEDFASYPRDTDRDSALAAAAGVDLLFLPSTPEVYPPGYRTFVEVEGLGERLCGRSRPGHFRGVATIVAKLLGIVRPDHLLLGSKDAQQLAVLRRMTADLCLGVEVVGCPTVREPDGLARSSRNAHLSPDERTGAVVLYRALARTELAFAAGERRAKSLEAVLRAVLATERLFRLDYAEVVDPETLAPPADDHVEAALAAVAGHVGQTRLIDNVHLGPSPEASGPESGS